MPSAFCACVLWYLEPFIVFKAKVARHVRMFNNKLLDRTQVSQLRNIFSKTYLMKIIPEKRSAHFI